MGNLDLWLAVEKTPTSETKPITGRPYSGTSPKPHYLIRRATETFGPCGIGWGFEIVDEKLLDGALLETGFFQRIHMARVRVWYEWQGKRGLVEHVGQTEFCGRRSNGRPFTDEDAPKKSVTDALVKALSMIGFAGDIFSGRYDDSKYVAGLRQEEREAQSAVDDERRPLARNDGAVGPSIAAQRMARAVRECRYETDITSLRDQAEFQTFWRNAEQVDRKFVINAVDAWKARHSPAEAA